MDDLDRGLLRMIDQYILDAMTATGTRRAPRPQRHDEPHALVESDPEPADLEPADASTFADEEETFGGVIVIDEKNADAGLLAQVTQQLSDSESAIEPLPRSRAARGTVELDEEITNILAGAPSKPD